MGSSATILMVCLVLGYLLIEQVFVTSPKFLPFYIIGSAIVLIMTI
jgi:hypothetical protein